MKIAPFKNNGLKSLDFFSTVFSFRNTLDRFWTVLARRGTETHLWALLQGRQFPSGRRIGAQHLCHHRWSAPWRNPCHLCWRPRFHLRGDSTHLISFRTPFLQPITLLRFLRTKRETRSLSLPRHRTPLLPLVQNPLPKTKFLTISRVRMLWLLTKF